MDKKILVQELADALAKNKDISKKDAETFVRSVFEIVEEYLVTDKIVKIKELGTFKLVVVDSRESVNVNTGERIRIASHAKVSFTPDKSLADLVNRPFSDFETVILNEGTDIEEMERIELPVAPLAALTPEPEDVSSEEPVAEEPVVEEPAAEVPIVEEPVAEETAEEEIPAVEEPSVPETVVPEPVAAPEPVENAPEELEETVEDPAVEEPAAEVEEPVAEELVEQEVVTEQKQQVVNQHVGELNVATQHVEHQTIQQINRPEDDEDRDGVRISWGGVAAFVLLTILLMIGSFYAGYRMHPMPEFVESDTISTTDVVPAAPVQKVQPKAKPVRPAVKPGKHAVKPAGKPAKPAAKPVKSKKPSPAELAKKYDQIEGGEYWIVGTKDTHEMAVGDNLYKIAKATYGDKELARYIIKYNNIENPDVIHLGTMLKLPELVKKN